jgi:hypothetical protein
MKALCVLGFLLATQLSGAEEPGNKTFGLDNGRFWNTLTPANRQTYVEGILQGWQLRGFTEELVEARVLHLFNADGQFNSSDVADIASTIYRNADNLPLPVGWVVLAALTVERGENDTHTILAALRKKMSELRKTREPRMGTDLIPIDAILGGKKK